MPRFRCCSRPPPYEIYKARAEFAAAEVETLVVSCVVSFISALLATKFLLRLVSRYSFAGFAWYRIVFGAVILITAYTGLVQWYWGHSRFASKGDAAKCRGRGPIC